MNLRDDRELSYEELHNRRKQALFLYEKGETHKEIARLLKNHISPLKSVIYSVPSNLARWLLKGEYAFG